MLTKQDIEHFKNELLNMKKKTEETNERTNQTESIQHSSGELSMYDNHPADMGTELFEREKDRALHEQSESQISHINHALAAIEKGTYGKCEVCNRTISYERLEAIPYTTLCIDHAESQEGEALATDTAFNEVENPFESTEDPEAIDYENSFHEVAEFGTSDSPSDFIRPNKPSYMDDVDEETDSENKVDTIVGKSVTNNNNNDM